MFIKNLKLDVIATFEDQNQEMFQLKFLTKEVLKNRESLFTYIFKQLENKSGLVKLSLCWITKDITKFIKKHSIVKESIEANGKYVFGSWA
jgi:hypothetical protein|tara:strand:+ start:391 stop:663 length:273 start_codon:yes stop_codon:yes gene_type:complete